MKVNFRNIGKFIFKINWKTIVFNLHYFELKTALQFPVLIHRKTKFLSKKGRVILPSDVTFGMITIGSGGAPFEVKNSTTVWQLDGDITFHGKANIANGSIISVSTHSQLLIGENFRCGKNTKILCRKQIEFESNCLLSWNITVMDTDFHTITDHDEKIINQSSVIHLEENVWVGCHAAILKGVRLSKGTVVAGFTTVSKSASSQNTIIASSKQQVIKENIIWRP